MHEAIQTRPDILTIGGTYFNLDYPELSVIDIRHLAHSLAHQCRFVGHCYTHYSVAQHCVLVSHILPAEHMLAGLLHDGAEMATGDINRPLKVKLRPLLKPIEDRIEQAIFAHFGLEWPPHPCIKVADRILLATEQRDVMAPHDDEWAITEGIAPLPTVIEPWSAEKACAEFLHRFNKLTGSNVDAGPVYWE